MDKKKGGENMHTKITTDMQLREIVSIKGGVAEVILNAIFSENEQPIPCSQIAVPLKTALELHGLDTGTFSSDLIRDLNAIPDSK